MTQPVQVVNAVTLPTWTDPTSVAMYLTTSVSAAIGIIAIFHPGFNPPATDVQAVIGGVAILVAAGAQVYNAIRHTTATSAAIANGAALAVPASKAKPVVVPQPQPVPGGANVTTSAPGIAAAG